MNLSRALLGFIAAGSLAQDATAGLLRGEVRDLSGRPVARATVLICDAATGLPLDRHSWQPIDISHHRVERSVPQMAAATTDEAGNFAFDDLPPGHYRVVAQRWIGSVPENADLWDVRTREIELLGAARAEIGDDEAAPLALGPLGEGVLHIDCRAGNNETLLMVSTQPAIADPVLGFTGWFGPFLQNWIGYNRMPSGETTIRGLPEGTVHFAVFSADNNPGWGGGEVRLQAAEQAWVQVPFVASWSDGVHSPPERLEPLLQAIQQDARFTLDGLLEQLDLHERQQHDIVTMMRRLANLTSRTVEVGGREVPALDALAAAAYARMQSRLQAQGRTPNPWAAARVTRRQ